MLPGPGPGDDAVRALAHAILDRPEYGLWRPSRFGEWLGRVVEWFASLLATSPLLFWVIVAALTLTLFGIVAHLVWTVRKGIATEANADAPRADDGPRFAEEADALARRGRFLDAARVMQLGAIDRLVRAGRLRLGRGDPNAVLRRRLGEASLADGVRRDLLAAIADLERRWFRDRDEDEDLYRRWLGVHAALDTTLTTA